jgi:hypothetical protein
MRGNPLFVQKAGFPRTPSGKNSNIASGKLRVVSAIFIGDYE